MISIGERAFYECKHLTSIIIPDSVKEIRCEAFGRCYGLKNVTIPPSVTSIGESAFWSCIDLTYIEIGSGVRCIGKESFRCCLNLKSIIIPQSVISIGKCAFASCYSLISIIVEEGNEVYDSRGECNAIIKTDDNELITGCLNTKIPNTVTKIGFGAFLDCRISSISIPESVFSIGDKAFDGCEYLTSVFIPESVINIGVSAFGGCFRLLSINIPSGISHINTHAFCYCGITSITIPDGVTSIDYEAFCNCENLTSLTIPDFVRHIGNGAFSDCNNLLSINLPLCISHINKYSFDSCGLTSITIPNGVISIDDDAFRDCKNLSSITIPDSVKYIGDNAFYGCSKLVNISISNKKARDIIIRQSQANKKEELVSEDIFNSNKKLCGESFPNGISSAFHINGEIKDQIYENEGKYSRDVRFVENDKVGLKSHIGQLLLPALYDDIPEVYDRERDKLDIEGGYNTCIPVVKDNQYALAEMNGNGTLLTPFKYDKIFRHFGNREAYFVCEKGKKKGLLNSKGEEVIRCEMDEIYEQIDEVGIIPFIKGRNWGLYYGHKVTEPIFSRIRICSGQYAKVLLSKGLVNEWGWIDGSGQFTLDESKAYFGSWRDSDKYNYDKE